MMLDVVPPAHRPIVKSEEAFRHPDRIDTILSSFSDTRNPIKRVKELVVLLCFTTFETVAVVKLALDS